MNLTISKYIEVFMQHELNLAVLVISLTIAIGLLFVIRNSKRALKQKIMLMYAHIMFLILPFVFVLFNKGCEQQIYSCDLKTFAIGLPAILGGLLIGIVTVGYFVIPAAYRNKGEKMDSSLTARKIRSIAKKMGWSIPSVFALDTAKPKAFAFSQIKPSIFVSIGLWEMLSKKELEAVMLHELWHTNSNSASFKVSAFASRLLSPLSGFSSLRTQLEDEEMMADKFAVKIQGTNRYLNSAKRKIENYS